MNLNNHRVLFHWCLPPFSWWAGSVGDFTLRSLEDPVIAIMSVEDSGGVLVRESSSALVLAETYWTLWEIPKAPHTLHQSSSLLFLSGILNIICPHCVLVKPAVCKWYKTTLQPTSSTVCIHPRVSTQMKDWGWKYQHIFFLSSLPQWEL